MDFNPIAGGSYFNRIRNKLDYFPASGRNVYLHSDQCLRMYLAGIG
jgi:hypothetical protein